MNDEFSLILRDDNLNMEKVFSNLNKIKNSNRYLFNNKFLASYQRIFIIKNAQEIFSGR